MEILGEFDDAALMKAFGAAHNAIFVAPTLYAHDFYADESIVEIGRMENVMEEYHAILAERNDSASRGTAYLQPRLFIAICAAAKTKYRQNNRHKKTAFAGFFNKVQQAGD